MARRRGGGAGWLLILLLVVGGTNLLSSRPKETSTYDNDVSIQPLAHPPTTVPSSKAPATTTIPRTTLYVTADTLNVRASPSTTGEVLLTAPRGTAVLAVSRSGDWFEVELNNGGTAWMNGTYLSTAPPQREVQAATPPPPPAKGQIDRNAVVRALIAESIASYPGSCPCPYNTDRAGRSCGRRSAWSKAGGYAPLCYAGDVTPAMIESYLARH